MSYFFAGIVSAIITTAGWIVVQNVLIHIRPADNRFKAMLWGYIVSLPFVLIMYQYVIQPFVQSETGGYPVGLFHAYALHLLLFFLYVECFYYVERSVTLRFLVEFYQAPGGIISSDEIRQKYNLSDMIRQRLNVAQNNGFISEEDGFWKLTPKGKRLAKTMQCSIWIFQSKPQQDRV